MSTNSLGVASLGSEFDPAGLRSGLNAARGETEGWLGSWRRIWEMTAGYIIANVIMRIAGAIRDLGREVLDAVASFQLLEIQLSGLIASETVDRFGGDFQDALAGSTQRVQELIGWIKQLAITTPFTVQTLQRTLAVSMAMGFTSDESQTLTKAIGNFTAGMGLSQEIMERIIYNFGQMKAAGKVTGTELRDLARGGFVPIVKVLEIMQENMGMTNMKFEDFRKLAGSGAVDVNEFFRAFEQLADERFPNAMERMSQTWAGLTGNIKDFIQSVVGAGLFGPAFSKITSALALGFQQLIDPQIQDAINGLGLVLARFFEIDLTNVEEIKTVILEFIWVLTGALRRVQETGDWGTFWTQMGVPENVVSGLMAIKDWFDTAGQWLVDNGANIKAALIGIGVGLGVIMGVSAVVGILTALTNPLTLLVLLAGLVAVAIANWDVVVAKFEEIKAAVIDWAMGMWNAFIQWAKPAIDFLASIGAVLGPSIQGLIDAILPVWDQLKAAFEDLKPAFAEFFNAIQPVVEFGKEFLINFFAILGVILIGALGLIVGVINGIVTGVTYFMNVFGLIVEGVKIIIQGIVEFATGFWNIIQGLFTGNGELLLQGLMTVFSGILNFITGTIMTIVGLVTGVFMFLWGLVSGFVTGVIQFFTTLWMTLVGGSIIPEMLNAILFWFTSIFTNISEFVLGFIAGLLSAFVAFGSTIRVSIEESLAEVIARFKSFITRGEEIISFVKGALSPAFTGLQKVINAVAGAVSSLLSSFLKLAQNLPSLFIPGSPTPFEVGLWGIHDAMNALSDQALTGLGLGLEASLSTNASVFSGSEGLPSVGSGNSFTFYMQDTTLDEDQLVRIINRAEMLNA